MAQRAGRVGVNPADVNPVTGHVNVEVPGNVYTKTQVDNKFLTKTKAASDYQGKNLAVPIQMLDGTKLTVEAALQGLNSQKQNMQLAVPIKYLNGSVLGTFSTVQEALSGSYGENGAMTNADLTENKQDKLTVTFSNVTNVPTGITPTTNDVRKYGNIVTLVYYLQGVTAAAYGSIGTIPAGYRPVYSLRGVEFFDHHYFLDNDGKISCKEALSDENVYIVFTYIT